MSKNKMKDLYLWNESFFYVDKSIMKKWWSI